MPGLQRTHHLMRKIQQPYSGPTPRRAPSNLGSGVSRAPNAAPDKTTSAPGPQTFFPLCTQHAPPLLSFSLLPPPPPPVKARAPYHRRLDPRPKIPFPLPRAAASRFAATMAAEGEGKNPAGGGGGDNPQHQQAVQAAPVPVPQGEAAQEAGGQGTGLEPEGEKADREVEGGGAGEKDDAACRDLVLVEDPEVVAVEDPEEGTAPVLADSLSLCLSPAMALVVLVAPVGWC